MSQPSTKIFPGIKSYVLRSGRETAAQRRSYDSLSGQFIIPFDNTYMNFPAVFGNGNPVIVEIGFGMGIATAIIAGNNPEKNFLGIEVHKAGIGKLLWEINRRSLGNIRIIEHDAVEVFDTMIPPHSLAGVHLFFPDPWPKQRHHKRRLVKRPFTHTIAGRLETRGYLYMVTDWEDYAQWALAELGATCELTNVSCDFAERQAWRPCTSFEKKAQEKGRYIKELLFVNKENRGEKIGNR